jgi:acyl carrier protein
LNEGPPAQQRVVDAGNSIYVLGFKRIGWARNKGAEMQFVGIDRRTLKSGTGITRAEIESAFEQIVAAVADEHGLVEARDGLTLRSNLHDDLGMDEVDLIEILFRAEERFGLVLPDNNIGPSSTVNDIVDLIADRLREKEVQSAQAQDSKEAWKELPEQEQPESTLVGPDQGVIAEDEVPELS